MPAKKGLQPEPSESMIHIRIAEPSALRRQGLNLALDVIQLLKRYERLKAVRTKKEATRKELSRAYGEMRRMIQEIKLKDLPHTPEMKTHEEEKHIELPRIQVQMPPQKVKSPLEKEMDDIRNKLASL